MAAPMSDRPEISFHDGMAARWEDIHRSRAFRTRTAAMFGLLDALPSLGQSWLDAGCGTGTLSRRLARRGLKVQGVDASAAMVAAATELSRSEPAAERLSFRQIETVERLPFENNTFDGILCASVLEYTQAPEKSLAEFERILRDKGLLLISLANRRSMLRGFYKFARGLCLPFGVSIFRYLEFSHFDISFADAERLLRAHGFTVLGYNFTGTPFPHFLNSRSAFGTLINILARRTDKPSP